MFQFDRVVCINLARRPERWQGFQEAVAAVDDWPFGAVERFEAIDCQRCPYPHWWQAGDGSWGIAMSTLAIIQDALNRDLESVLVFEDDALFAEGFGEKAREFFDLLPDNWDGLYLGGEDRKAPLKTGHVGKTVEVLRSQETIRLHGYALRRRYMMAAYQSLTSTVHWATEPKAHVDERMGALHKLKNLYIYEPSPWLVGQRAVEGDITTRNREKVEFWEEHRMNPPAPPTGARA